jgi:hypothetical protein
MNMYSIAVTLIRPCTESLSHNLCSSYNMYRVETGYMCFMAHHLQKKQQTDGPPKLMKIIS